MANYAGTVTEQATGSRYEYQHRFSWGKTYYCFDGRSWHKSKADAFNLAKLAGLLQPEGTIRSIQDGQPDKFIPRSCWVTFCRERGLAGTRSIYAADRNHCRNLGKLGLRCQLYCYPFSKLECWAFPSYSFGSDT
jgi:hypothetical protein